MRRWPHLLVVLGSAWIGAPVGAQMAMPSQVAAPPWAPMAATLSVPPPPPVLPELIPPRPPAARSFDLGRCTDSLGQVGCAARLYAQLLCDHIGLQTPLNQLHRSLQTSFEQAAIDFQGITPAGVETAAVRYYTPQLCPLKSEKIIDLLQRQGSPSQAPAIP